jgi:hypothetical protein
MTPVAHASEIIEMQKCKCGFDVRGGKAELTGYSVARILPFGQTRKNRAGKATKGTKLILSVRGNEIQSQA